MLQHTADLWAHDELLILLSNLGRPCTYIQKRQCTRPGSVCALTDTLFLHHKSHMDQMRDLAILWQFYQRMLHDGCVDDLIKFTCRV